MCLDWDIYLPCCCNCTDRWQAEPGLAAVYGRVLLCTTDIQFIDQIGESGWAAPLPLESSNNNSQPDDVSTKPVVIRAQIPEWGTVHEVVARVEMAGVGFERTMVGDDTVPCCLMLFLLSMVLVAVMKVAS